jgi:hypothetical protein
MSLRFDSNKRLSTSGIRSNGVQERDDSSFKCSNCKSTGSGVSDRPSDYPLGEITVRVREMEKLVAEALRDESSTLVETLTKKNRDLQAILTLLKLNVSNSINDLLLLLEEESTLRADAEAELGLNRTPLNGPVLKSGMNVPVNRNHDGPPSKHSDIDVALRRVMELQAECDMLKEFIKKERANYVQYIC